jgi:hypothetical protein
MTWRCGLNYFTQDNDQWLAAVENSGASDFMEVSKSYWQTEQLPIASFVLPNFSVINCISADVKYMFALWLLGNLSPRP